MRPAVKGHAALALGYRRLMLTLAGPILVLSGCASYTPRPLDPEVAATALEERRLDDPRLARFIVAVQPEAAPTDVSSLVWDLSTLTLAALYFHPDIEIGRAKIAVATAGITTAAQIPNPNLALSPSYHTVATPTSWTVGILVNLVLETFGKREIRVEQAKALVEAARQDLATASWQIRGRVRSSLLDLWAASGRMRLIAQRRAVQEQLVALLERRFAAGDVAVLDIARERINLNQIELSLREAERQAAEACVRLAAAVGVPVRAFDGVEPSTGALERPATMPDLADLSTGALRRQALRQRPDIQALLAQYEASQSALRLEIARQYPDLTLGPGYTYDQGDNLFSFGFSADLPILNQNQGSIAAAEARRQEAAARFLALQAQIVGEIDAAVAGYRAAARTAATADALLEDQRRRGQRLERAFREGEIDRSGPLTAQLELAATDLSRFEALAEQRRALAAIEDAVQRGMFDSGDRYVKLTGRIEVKHEEELGGK